jgi:hypothetical protein
MGTAWRIRPLAVPCNADRCGARMVAGMSKTLTLTIEGAGHYTDRIFSVSIVTGDGEKDIQNLDVIDDDGDPTTLGQLIKDAFKWAEEGYRG